MKEVLLMNYEVVQLAKKTVAGSKIRTSNSDPNMIRDIGELWHGFFANGIYESIANKKNDKSIGLYTNYEVDLSGAYDLITCCEIQKPSDLPIEIGEYTIPSGKYAKFTVRGDMQKAVGDFWMKLWSMDLDRKYSCDFEEYQSSDTEKDPEIHIYIALK